MFVRRLVVCALAVGIPVAALGQGAAFDLAPGQKVLAPIQYQQLTVFPVVQLAAAAGVDKTQYLTLAEGLKAKTVTVSEDKGGAQVNRVTVANHSPRPLLLLGGEIILGGQQDRILGKDTILPPGEEMSLEVFCVEHGRWSGQREFSSSGGLVESKARLRAKFDSNQQEVWDEVRKKNAALKADPATGTYRNLATGAEGEAAMKPYREHVRAALDKLPESKQMIGVVAAVNGRVTSVEIFANPALFAAYRDKILDSLFVTVADVPVAAQPAPAPAAQEIRAFMKQADDAKDEQVLASKRAKTIENKGKSVVKSKVTIDGAPADKPVYQSYQRAE
jgi:ARG and Rhodanese-Phosphatase-superfamily-associated Protein domain